MSHISSSCSTLNIWSNDNFICIKIGLTLAELPSSASLLTVQHNSFLCPLHECCLCHKQKWALFTVQLQLNPSILTLLTSPPALSCGTNTSHSLPPCISRFVSKFLSPLSAFDPLILPLCQLTHTLSSLHQTRAHRDGALTRAHSIAKAVAGG